MDNSVEWARIAEAASRPDLISTVEQRVALLEAALQLGLTITPDSVGSSVTLATDAGYSTPAASNGLALELDLAQYAEQDGPCIAACRDGLPHSIVIMSEEQAYPGFTRAAQEHGVRSSLSLPLALPSAAALNLYASSTNAFDAPRDRATAALLANCIGRFLPEPARVPRASPADTETALGQRRLISRARERLSQDSGISGAAAFERLVTRSRRERRSIFAVARAVLDDAEKTDDGAPA